MTNNKPSTMKEQSPYDMFAYELRTPKSVSKHLSTLMTGGELIQQLYEIGMIDGQKIPFDDMVERGFMGCKAKLVKRRGRLQLKYTPLLSRAGVDYLEQALALRGQTTYLGPEGGAVPAGKAFLPPIRSHRKWLTIAELASGIGSHTTCEQVMGQLRQWGYVNDNQEPTNTAIRAKVARMREKYAVDENTHGLSAYGELQIRRAFLSAERREYMAQCMDANQERMQSGIAVSAMQLRSEDGQISGRVLVEIVAASIPCTTPAQIIEYIDRSCLQTESGYDPESLTVDTNFFTVERLEQAYYDITCWEEFMTAQTSEVE